MTWVGLIGYPLTHSFSKQYFTSIFSTPEFNDWYFENFELLNLENFKELFCKHPNLIGLAITIPYKKKVVPFLDDMDITVRKIHSCNCILKKNNKLIGFNTDILGFKYSISPLLKPHHKSALILGTGGASAAVAEAFLQLQINFKFVSRQAGAEVITYEYLLENKEILNDFQIIVNTTPLGTFPKEFEFPPIPYLMLNESHLVYDLVYNPPLTTFLKKAQQQQAKIKNGYDMLKIQADENFKIWYKR